VGPKLELSGPSKRRSYNNFLHGRKKGKGNLNPLEELERSSVQDQGTCGPGKILSWGAKSSKRWFKELKEGETYGAKGSELSERKMLGVKRNRKWDLGKAC